MTAQSARRPDAAQQRDRSRPGWGSDDGSSETPRDPRLLGGYAMLLSGYGVLAAALTWAVRRRRQGMAPMGARELITYSLATQQLTRLIAKDSVTSVVRSPFTRFEEPAGEGEVNEEVVGTGLRHAVGELISCPFCLAQWVATALVAGRILLPEMTTAVVSLSAVARVSDYLQLLYGIARERQ